MHSSDLGIGYINEEVEIVHECKNLIFTMVELSWYQNEMCASVVWYYDKKKS